MLKLNTIPCLLYAYLYLHSCFSVLKPTHGNIENSSLINSMGPGPPRLQIRRGNGGATILSDNGTDSFFLIVKNSVSDKIGIEISCTACYPILLIYDVNQVLSSVNSFTLYTNFQDNSTYSFKIVIAFDIEPTSKYDRITCKPKAIDSQFSGRDFVYEILQDEKMINFSIANSLISGEPPTAQNNSNSTDCPVLFYYKETKNSFYSYFCKFSDGKPGEITTNGCVNNQRCPSLIKTNRLVGRECWKRVDETNSECRRCPQFSDSDFRSSFLTCTIPNEMFTHFLSPTAIIFYGLPPDRPGRPLQTPKIYFHNDPTDQETMIQIKEFQELQILGGIVLVKCSASAHIAAETFQFALEFEGQPNYTFVNVDNKPRYSEKTHALMQFIGIELNDTSLKRIHCYASIANSYEWLHASRPVNVVDYLDYYKKQDGHCPPSNEGLQPPKWSVILDGVTVLETGRETVYEASRAFLGSQKQFKLNCMSSNYLRMIFYQNPNDTEDIPIITDWDYHWSFQDFKNASTFTFFQSIFFKFVAVKKRHLFHCYNIQDPCSSSTLQYSFNEQKRLHQFQLLPITRDLDLSALLQRGTKSACEAIFYYERRPEPETGYNFYCKFPFGEIGDIFVYDDCGNAAQCASIYGDKRQPRHGCWQKYDPKKCEGCPKREFSHYRPYVLSCAKSAGTGHFKNEESLSTIIFYGPSIEATDKHPIFFGDNDGTTVRSENDIFFMEPIEEIQLVNQELTVTCIGSVYYIVRNIYLALEYLEKENFEIIGASTKFGELDKNLIWSPILGTVSKQQNILMAKGLHKIHCLSWSLATGKIIQVSTNLLVLETAQPRIRISRGVTRLGKLEEYSNYLEKTFNLSQQIQNPAILCTAIGKPVPTITWTHNGSIVSFPNNNEAENAQFRWSQILNPVEGVYICTATSDHHNEKALGTITINFKPLDLNPSQSQSSSTLVLSIVLPVIIVIILIIVTVVLWHRCKYLSLDIHNLTDKDVEDFINGAAAGDLNDPSGDIYAQPYNNKYETSRSHFEFDETQRLGSGQFGMVIKGFVTKDGTRRLVAIKSIKKNMEANVNVLALLSEIKIMAYLEHHSNIASLVAACTEDMKRCDIYAAIEFCSKGDLKKFLQTYRPTFFTSCSNVETSFSQLDSAQLFSFATGIANGMCYLAFKNVIHGDLAARNILVTEDFQVKISDFGLSRRLIDYSNYVKKSREVPLPFKWMAVETLKELKFSLKSDVWSYGVILFEIFSLGETPFPGCQWNPEFVQKIIEGYRMKKPEFASDEMYNIMLSCWDVNPDRRPSIDEIHKTIVACSSLVKCEELQYIQL